MFKSLDDLVITFGRQTTGGGGGGDVTAFNGRTGSVIPQFQDYSTFYNEKFVDVVPINSAADVVGPFSSNKLYYITVSTLDMTGSGNYFEVPPNGLHVRGLGNNLTTVICSDDNYNLFDSPVSESGNLVINDMGFAITGTNSKVYNLTDYNGGNAVETYGINYYNCTSLGQLTNYRQVLGNNIGRFGGTPELTFNGTFNGFREDLSIVREIGNITSLFKEGTSLSITGRFNVNINCDLPATGSLCDFSESNIANDESLIFQNCFITRQGVVNTVDANITPNVSHESVKSKWSDNTGMPDTTKYLEAVIATEVETPIAASGTYYPLEGTWTVNQEVQFDMPVNGQYRLLTGNGAYQINGDFTIDGSQNDIIDLRVTVSSDGGVTFPLVVNHTRRPVNNLQGGRDVAFFNLNFITTLKKNDRIRIEVENVNDTNNVTAEEDCYLNISRV
jgi:hypothetical protein